MPAAMQFAAGIFVHMAFVEVKSRRGSPCLIVAVASHIGLTTR